MSNDRLNSSVAVLIALVTILGATAACLASVALSSAGDQDFAGMSAAINVQRAQIVNHVDAYEHYRAYTSYTRYFELGNIEQDEAAHAGSGIAAELDKQRQEAWGVAGGLLQSFFPPRYMDKNGYNVQRELDELWAKAKQDNDMESKSHFDSADSLRARSSFLAADFIVFAVSFWFLTLTQIIENRWKYLALLFGVLAGLAGILGIIIAQVML